jgi:thiamine-monophosphate kinase
MMKSAEAAPAEVCVASYLRPEPRVRLGLLLSRNRAAVACIDLSDGLADGVRRLAEAGGVGAIVDADVLPIEPAARHWFASRREDAVTSAVAAGDDYELLFAVRPRLRRRLAAAIRHGGAPLTRIGVFTSDTAVVLRRGLAGAATETPLTRGYAHFR